MDAQVQLWRHSILYPMLVYEAIDHTPQMDKIYRAQEPVLSGSYVICWLYTCERIHGAARVEVDF